MLKKTITYTDFNDVKRTEDFYFNLTRAELTEMQLSKDGGLQAWLEKIIKTDNRPELIKAFKSIILKAYGEKSDDGKRFIKSEALSEAFEQSAAYDELFVELLGNEAEAGRFINGLIPKSLAESVDKGDARPALTSAV